MIRYLYNRGPHRDCYRGAVLVVEGRMTWAGSDTEVQQWHGDFLLDDKLEIATSTGVSK